ncbi:MAG TPA: hypothetical protein VFY85_06695 [Gemmatimonadaceae bacterium]|nr:hypothetical protein [Gemmatimonadaceae bacterium]
MDRDERSNEREQERESVRNETRRDDELHADERANERDRDLGTNPPRTTTGKMTSPKFGSATSGGGEFEPGPEQD